MVSLSDLIPERAGSEVPVTVDTDDGMLVVTIDNKKVLEVTIGDGKILLLALCEAYGKKYIKKMLKVKTITWVDTQ